MSEIIVAKNWVTGKTQNVLSNIHQKGVNISIYNRDIKMFDNEINNLLEQGVQFKFNGDVSSILNEIKRVISNAL